jgi:hypothetical protein
LLSFNVTPCRTEGDWPTTPPDLITAANASTASRAPVFFAGRENNEVEAGDLIDLKKIGMLV